MKDDIERFRLALLVVLQSDNDNEVVNAARLIRRWLKRKGKDAYWLFDQLGSGPPAPVFLPIERDTRDWREQAAWLVERSHWLTDRELEFVTKMNGKAIWFEPTGKQAGWLRAIYRRVQIVDAYQQPAS